MTYDEIDTLLRKAGMEAVHLSLAAAMPIGTRHERIKAKAFAAGVTHAVASLRAVLIERAS